MRRPHPAADPLAPTDRLLVDGSNLLHALARGAAATGPMPAAALIGRLRGVVPADVGIELVLDGAPEPGLHGSRIASGLIVRYAGRRSADELLMRLVDEARMAAGGSPQSVDNILVVTDDRELREQLHRKGARTAGSRWLLGRLERGRLDVPATGNRTAPTTRPSASPPDDAEGDDRPSAWRPGRGATTKRGNPRRRRQRRE